MSTATFEERIAGLKAEKAARDFWDVRPHLKHIRDAAHSRQRSAPATLAVVLARVAAIVSHRIRLPPIVGSDSSVSVLVAVVAPAGVGKSSATAIGSELLPVPEGLDVLDQLPIGSGEGLAESFFGMVDETDDQGKTAKVKRQVRHNAMVVVDEGQVLTEIGGRRGATLLPTLRSIFSGATLGQQNASEERRRVLPARSYTMGVAIALQSTLASALLDDAAGGTPQRILWVPAVDDTLPPAVEGSNGLLELPDLPEWPGPLPWRPPAVGRIVGLGDDGLVQMETGPVYLRVAGSIRREIRLADLARARGEATVETLDAHEALVRLKVAALFALLDDRLDINDEDWWLATTLKAVSDSTREGVVAAVRREQTEQERQASAKLANRAVHADLAVTRRRVVDCARKLAVKVWAEPERWTVAELRRSMRLWRDVLDEGLDHAAAEGWVMEAAEPGQGDGKRAVRPGERRPM